MRSIVAACALASMLSIACPAAAKDYVVGVEELDYLPIYGIRDGRYSGAAREILDRFAADRGHSFTYRPLPIKRLFSELAGGMIDFKFPDNPYWNPDAKKGKPVVYSQPAIRYVDGVLVVPDNRDKGPDAIAVLGTVSGFTPFAWLDRIGAGKTKLEENSSLPLLLKQAATGRIDGAYANVAVANHHLAATPGALVFAPNMPHTKDGYMLSTTRHPAIVAEFDQWLASNRAVVEEIKRRYDAEKGID